MQRYGRAGAFALCSLLSATVTVKLSASQSKQRQPQDEKQGRPEAAASPQELFRRLSPSVVAVEALNSRDSVKLIGSGVVLAPDSIVTNRHVLSEGSKVRIVQGSETCRASVAWVDPDHDLAVLRINRGQDPACRLNAPSVPLRLSPNPAVGERVYAIGTPEGLELSLSEGIISGLREFENGHVIQTSAAISHGSSGGGLFDAEGRLIGITTFFVAEGQNLNFAIPANWVQLLLEAERSRSSDNHSTPDVFGDATMFMYNVNELESGGLLPYTVSSEESSAMWAIADGALTCMFDQAQKPSNPDDPDCSHNWPVWKEASIKMLALRGEIHALESAADKQARVPSGDKYDNPESTRKVAEYGGSIWSKLKDVYCQNRPDGIYTDLHGEIRACQ